MLFNFIQKEESQVIPNKFKTICVENWFGFFGLFSVKMKYFIPFFPGKFGNYATFLRG